MKNLIMLVMAAAVLQSFAADAGNSSIEAARASIQDAVKSKSAMVAVMKKLSAEDQKTFVGEVMAAIAKLPGSPEERAAMYLNAARAAIDGAAKGNVTEIVAEIYATVPVSSLPIISESLAENVFNRAANPNTVYTDEKFVGIVQNVMKTMNERLESAEDSGVRAGFAALMMVKASNSETPEIQNAAIKSLPVAVQGKAANEWFPAALASGDGKSYEPMLGVADSELSRPIYETVLRIAGPQSSESMLADLSGANTDMSLAIDRVNPVVDTVQSPLVYELPNLGNGGVNAVVPSPVEAGGYPYQTTSL